MVEPKVSIGDLIQAGPYARRGTFASRYAARFYSGIIFVTVLAILLVTYWQSRSAPPAVHTLLLAGAAVYLLYFVPRPWLPGDYERLAYYPLAQVLRCQAGVLGTTALVAGLAHFGLVEHDLWLLYVLGTLVLSESLPTPTVLLTLVEVAVLLFTGSYIIPTLWAGSQITLPGMLAVLPVYAVRVLWIWLLTFLLHYLMRNIQARQEAFGQHGEWRRLVADQWNTGQPLVQRRIVLEAAAKLTQARAALWLPRLSDRQLVNDSGEVANALVQKVAFDLGQAAVAFGPAYHGTVWGRLRTALGQYWPSANLRGLLVLPDLPASPDALAQVFIPISKPGDGSELLGVLDLTYEGKAGSSFTFQLELDSQRLEDFVAELYPLLSLSLSNQQLGLLNKLALAWEAPFDAAATAREVVTQVVSRLGFDFATVNLVDAEHHRVSCAAELNAGWRDEASHDLDEYDVQCLVVKDGRTIVNTGEYEAYLDRQIWEKHGHRHTTRVWVPIGQPQGKGPEAVLGTIEAGFHHQNCREIPSDLQLLLEQYAAVVYPMLLSARQQTRNQKLLDALEALHEIGADLQQQAAVLRPMKMAELIGQSAEKVLGADIVMVFLPHKNRKRPKLAYMTGGALEESSTDGRGFWPYLSDALQEVLSSDQGPYFCPYAQSDPILVRVGPDRQPLPDGRSFTQRHGVQSFAGVPLVAQKAGILGYVCLDYRVHHEFYPEMRQIVRLFAEQAAAALLQTNTHHLALSVAIAHERNAMAANVHNRLSAGLACDQTLAQTAIEYLRQGDPRLCGKLEELLASIADNQVALHQIVGDVRGVANPLIDLSSGLRAQVELHYRRHRGKIVLNEAADPTVVVPAAVTSGLLSIVREALGNAVTHAPGSKIDITYRCSLQDGIRLVVADNGPGFDEARIPEMGRNGLFSLYMMAGQIGAQLSLTSLPGVGTTVAVDLPCQSLEDHHE